MPTLRTAVVVILVVFGLVGLALTLDSLRAVLERGWARPGARGSGTASIDPPVVGTAAWTADAVGASAPPRSASFEENRGQHDPRVRFMARGADFTVYLTPTESVYVLPISGTNPGDGKMLALRMALAGARADAPLSGEAPQARRVNYLRGTDPDKWVSDAPTFGRVRQDDVYEGVDVIWYANDAGTLEYDFEVAPARDPRAIEIAIDGASRVEIADDGDLWMHTDAGVLKQAKPIAYQERDGARVEISSGYEMRHGGRVGFRLGDYDDSRALVIDPNLGQLAFSTYIGGNGPDVAQGIAVDLARNVYVTGVTASTNFPTTSGNFDPSYNGQYDVFVTKLNAAGTTALYSTYLGGNGYDSATAIAIDSTGRAYVVGHTDSTNFPVTPGAFDTVHQGVSAAFVTQLAPNGATSGYSTYLGAAGSRGEDVAVDATGNAFVVGTTSWVDFPVTVGAFDTTFNGGSDYFVSKLNATGSALVYSTFLGGSLNERDEVAIALAGGNALIAGQTSSADFPTTSGAVDTSFGGGSTLGTDAVVVMINTSGSGLVGSTFLGGGGDDAAGDIAFGADGFVYVAGATDSINFPTTAGTFDPTINGNTDGFVTKLTLNLGALVYSTFIGGTSQDRFHALALEPRQCVLGFPCPPGHRVVAAGSSGSVNAPITANAVDSQTETGDAYVVLLNLAGSAVDYGSFLGGSGIERATAVAVDAFGNVFMGGEADVFAADPNFGTPFPIAGDSVFQKARGSRDDGFVSKLGTFVVSGRILTAGGAPVPGVTVTASIGFSATAQTDAQGFYVFDTPSTGSYRITPSQPGFVFTPLFKEFVNPQSNRVANFTRQ